MDMADTKYISDWGIFANYFISENELEGPETVQKSGPDW